MKGLKFVIVGALAALAAVSASPNAHGFEESLQWYADNEGSLKADALKEDNPDIYLDTPELIKRHGYPAEVHKVNTNDGYILSMHRIPHGINDAPDANKSRPVVFLQHGFICSSSDWVIMGPGKGLAFILADAGYDVWMGNARGNKYSRAHLSLDPEKSKFWEFSFNEMGIKDLPAEIDYVLAHTGHHKLFYVGHSMGTTMFYIMNSMRPEYNGKIRAMFSLAPVAFMGHLKSPIRLLAPFSTEVKWIAKMLGLNEFLPSTKFMTFVGSALCKDEAITQVVCSNALFLLCGYDTAQLNETTIPVILGHTPAGTSTRALIHFAQGVKSRNFQQYDYGLIGNLNHYKSIFPPKYDLKLVTAPVYLHYSDNDWMTHEEDVHRLSKELGNVAARLRVPHDQFNHLDFLWATDAKKYVYDKVMSFMKRLLAREQN